MQQRYVRPCQCCGCKASVLLEKCDPVHDDPALYADVPVVVKNHETGETVASGTAPLHYDIDGPTTVDITVGAGECSSTTTVAVDCGSIVKIPYYGLRKVKVYGYLTCSCFPGTPPPLCEPADIGYEIRDEDGELVYSGATGESGMDDGWETCKRGPYSLTTTDPGEDAVVYGDIPSFVLSCNPTIGLSKFQWPDQGLKIVVYGCGGREVTDASITIVDETDGPVATLDGKAGGTIWFPDHDRTCKITITADRFEPYETTYELRKQCDPQGTLYANLSPADGYACFGILELGDSPYPISTSLIAEDSQGQMVGTRPDGPFGSFYRFCHTVEMEHVGDTYGSGGAVAPCFNNPPPRDTGTGVVGYQIHLSRNEADEEAPGDPRQFYKANQFIARNGGFGGPLQWADAPPCTPTKMSYWRALWGAAPCSNVFTSTDPYTYGGAAPYVVINSWKPFSATFYFTDGDGVYDTTISSGADMTGDYVTGELTVSEA